MEEVVIGYDARDKWHFVPGLLRQDVKMIATADSMVWVSLMSDLKQECFGYPGLCTSLADVRQRVPKKKAKSAFIIAITVPTACLREEHFECWKKMFLDKHLQPLDFFSEFPARVDPQELSPAWEPLGYDVCDAFLISGLCNCGLGEYQAIRETWGSRISERHLLDDISDAATFAELAGNKIPVHSPFYVVRVYCLPLVSV